jgi:hypothetical protein
MKKAILVIVGVLVLLAVFGAAGFAYAQTQAPQGTEPPFSAMPGWGMMGRSGQGMMGAGGYGPMHDYMEQALATRLGLTEVEIEDRLAAGESMWSIAQAQGLTDAEIGDLMLAARDEALRTAVTAGALTQEQADWMSQHMQQMNGAGIGAGGCMGGSRQGARQGVPMGRWRNQP